MWILRPLKASEVLVCPRSRCVATVLAYAVRTLVHPFALDCQRRHAGGSGCWGDGEDLEGLEVSTTRRAWLLKALRASVSGGNPEVVQDDGVSGCGCAAKVSVVLSLIHI